MKLCTILAGDDPQGRPPMSPRPAGRRADLHVVKKFFRLPGEGSAVESVAGRPRISPMAEPHKYAIRAQLDVDTLFNPANWSSGTA